MNSLLEQNKAIVRRFNQEIIENGNTSITHLIFDPEFINHSAPLGSDNGPEGMLHTFNKILRPAFTSLRVAIYEQVAEDNIVTTRKTISGTHTGELLGINPTGIKVNIEVMDMVKIKNGKYYEHWGINTFPSIIAQLKGYKK